VSSVGQNWFSPWITYLITTDNHEFLWANGRGGMVSLTNSAGVDYRSFTSLVLVTNGSSVSRVINYPSGAQDVFDFAITNFM
jgi:hypothetical protein